MLTAKLTPEQKERIKTEGYFLVKAKSMGMTIEFIEAIESGRVSKPHVNLNEHYDRLGDLKEILDTCPVWLEESTWREIEKGRKTMRETLKARE